MQLLVNIVGSLIINFVIIVNCLRLIPINLRHFNDGTPKSNKTKGFMNVNFTSLDTRLILPLNTLTEAYAFSAQFMNHDTQFGGSIINNWCILTAAHCFNRNIEIGFMRIKVGQTAMEQLNPDMVDSQEEKPATYPVADFIIHKYYNFSHQPTCCDIALVFSNNSFNLGLTVQRSILVNNNEWMIKAPNDIYVTGWSWTKKTEFTIKDQILMATMNVLDKNTCEDRYQKKMSGDSFCLHRHKDRDVCPSVSGGGVFLNELLIGVIKPLGSSKCGLIGHQPVYATQILPYRGWIEKQIHWYYHKYCGAKRSDDLTFRVQALSFLQPRRQYL